MDPFEQPYLYLCNFLYLYYHSGGHHSVRSTHALVDYNTREMGGWYDPYAKKLSRLLYKSRICKQNEIKQKLAKRISGLYADQ